MRLTPGVEIQVIRVIQEGLTNVREHAQARTASVGGHPAWENFGAGPFEAVKGVTETRGDFVSDTSLEKYGLSFNPTGYLKRVRKHSRVRSRFGKKKR